MKAQTLCGVIVAAVGLVGTPVYADELSDQFGTYCSQITADGPWALSFAWTSEAENCRIAASALQSSWSPITATYSGFYRIYDWNTVTAVCWNYRAVYRGYGVNALQNAYQSLRNNSSGCEFYVD